jgi:hypothetical protein
MVGASSEQCKKLELHQMTMNQEILHPKIASKHLFTKKEIQKKNCLILILKNCNVAYLANAVTKNLRQILGTKNII